MTRDLSAQPVYVHVTAIIDKGDGTFEARHTRYPWTMSEEEGWNKIEAEVRNDLSCQYKLIMLVIDDDHQHPQVIIDGQVIDAEHMP